MLDQTSRSFSNRSFRNGQFLGGSRVLAAEVPVAVSYNGSTQAVMMATPADLEDFAIGFSLTEGIITDCAQIESIRVVEMPEGPEGFDVQVSLASLPEQQLAARRRFMAGPVGCGLCGIDSIEQAMRPVAQIASDGRQFTPQQIIAAVDALSMQQQLNRQTRAVHAAGFYAPEQGLLAAREDVGRHNALDKLVGHLFGKAIAPHGIVALTSRVSVEMVQKTAALGAPVLAAISAPSALAIKLAEAANLTLVALVRGDEFDVYSRPERIIGA